MHPPRFSPSPRVRSVAYIAAFLAFVQYRGAVMNPSPNTPLAGNRAWPAVSVIMPVLNEERHLAEAVHAVLAQDYPGELELVLAVGPSRDRTQEIAEKLAADDSRIIVVPNPTGRTPHGLNACIKASQYSIVVRVDGHSLLPSDYVRAAVETLEETGADNVGGLMAAEGVTPFEKAVARAMTSKIGIGNAPFHTGGGAGEAETVYLGSFRRSALDRVGGYDETFVRAQDWEMNHRIRQTGGKVWFTPRMHVTYRPRPERPRAGQAVLPHRPLAPRRGPRAPGHPQPALPRAADRRRRHRRRRRGRRRSASGRAGSCPAGTPCR